jgi:hypothetical protein
MMSYRTIQRRLRALGSTIKLNQKKTILLHELMNATERKKIEADRKEMEVEFIVLRNPAEIRAFTLSVISEKDSLCDMLGSDFYWKGLLTWPVDIVISAMHAGTVIGFVLIRTNYACAPTGCRTDTMWNSFYVEVICSKVVGVGGRLMDQVKGLAREEKKSKIHLSALLGLVSYYATKHQFQISNDCYPKMEKEIELLSQIRQSTQSIKRRRTELSYEMKQNPKKHEKAAIKSERGQLMARMKEHKIQETEVLEALISVSTYQLKHPKESATITDVFDEGIFMSFCVV